jgi:inhibitor of KinA
MKLEPLGDTAVVATLGTGIDPGTLASVRSYSEALVAAGLKGVTDVVPAYATVTVFYDASRFAESPGGAYGEVCEMMKALGGRASAAAGSPEARRVDIPVCYGGEFGPDLPALAQHCGLAAAEVATLHAGAEYLVHAIGFTPGFAYLGGLPEKLSTPRRPTPRSHVPAGSVAIGGSQTGVYPVASPGGWQIIGRTPVALFRPSRDPAAVLRIGDRVRFRAITEAEAESWR